MDTARPGAAPAGQHPFPLNRQARADRAKAFVLTALISAAVLVHCTGKLRDLVDEAEDDCGRAHRRGREEGHRDRKHRHGP